MIKIFANVVAFFKKLLGIKKKRVYGWKRDEFDHRDKKFTISAPRQFPKSVDISNVLPPAYDQTTVGSCTGNGVAAGMEYDQIIENKDFDTLFSRLFSYYNTRRIEGTTNEDAGGTIRDAIKAVNLYGICKESIWPYIESKFAVQPSEEAYKEAILHKSVDYSRLDNRDINQLKACLVDDNRPFIFGFQVFEFFESDEMAKTGILQLPRPGEGCQGGHCVICVGYDDEKQAFLIRNSWGPDWGIKGHFWMPYRYICNPNLASDFWTIKTILSNKD
jgi:C1A family cysteine protease